MQLANRAGQRDLRNFRSCLGLAAQANQGEAIQARVVFVKEPVERPLIAAEQPVDQLLVVEIDGHIPVFSMHLSLRQVKERFPVDFTPKSAPLAPVCANPRNVPGY